MDLFRKFGDEDSQEINWDLGHPTLVRRMHFEEGPDGAVELKRFGKGDLRLAFFRFFENRESWQYIIEVQNRMVVYQSEREWPVITVSTASPLTVGTEVFNRALRILTELEETVNRYGIDPSKTDWQSIGREDKQT